MPIWCFPSGSPGPLVWTAGEPWYWGLGRIWPAGSVESNISRLLKHMFNVVKWHAFCPIVRQLWTCLSLQLSRHPDYSERFSHFGYPPSPPLSYFSSGPEASSNVSLPTTHLNRVSLRLWTDMVFLFKINLCFGFKQLIRCLIARTLRYVCSAGRDEKWRVKFPE